MCTVFIPFNLSKKQPLLILQNRDEYFNRPSHALSWWPEGILAGKDLKSHGAWFGVNQSGTFCFITNYRDPSLNKPESESRGLLVKELLILNHDVDKARQHIQQSASKYNPFSVVFGNHEQAFCFSSPNKHFTKLTSGIYGLSNAYLDTAWHKVKQGKDLFHQVLTRNLEDEALWSILADKTKAREEDLPNTGITKDYELLLSSIFVSSPRYGTRASSILKQDHAGILHFAERSFSSSSQMLGEEAFRFKPTKAPHR